MIQPFDATFECEDAFYSVGDIAHASWPAIGWSRSSTPGISAGFGALVIELAGRSHVALEVKPLSKAQYEREVLIHEECASAVAAKRVGLVAQGPMMVLTRDVAIGTVGGEAGRTYWADWFCLSREPGLERHLIGLYAEPSNDEAENGSPAQDWVALLKLIFDGDGMPLIRVDFSNDNVWQRLASEATRLPENGALAGMGSASNPHAVSRQMFEGLRPSDFQTLFDSCDLEGYVALVDDRAMQEGVTSSEPTVLIVDLTREDEDRTPLPGSPRVSAFRCAFTELGEVEVQLAIGNLGFEDFLENLDSDGVFRGFRD